MSTMFSVRSTSKTLRALAWLLRYPNAEMRAALPDIRAALTSESSVSHSRLGEIERLIDRLAAIPALQAESEYVELFDRGRRTSLYLFEHVYGDSRDRGPAMIDLVKTYENAGLFLAESELPDYLPVVLEFASTQPAKEARAFLAETAHILRAIFTALVDRKSRYAAVIAAALELAGEKAERVKIVDEADIDESWAEPVAFGGCSTAGQSAPTQPQTIQFVRTYRDRVAA
jgi:nitrate reductase molybdenum cofactor assembly chaperone NarJ/NarW